MPTVAIPRKTTTATTTTPISQAVNVESLSRGTEVEEAMLELPVVWRMEVEPAAKVVVELPVAWRMEVEPAAKVVVELPVAWGTGVDSRPPALIAAATLKVLPATTSR